MLKVCPVDAASVALLPHSFFSGNRTEEGMFRLSHTFDMPVGVVFVIVVC